MRALAAEPVRPFEIGRPSGVSFYVSEYEVEWQGWHFHVPLINTRAHTLTDARARARTHASRTRKARSYVCSTHASWSEHTQRETRV